MSLSYLVQVGLLFRPSSREPLVRFPRTSSNISPWRTAMTSLSKDARIAGALYIVASIFGVVNLVYVPSKVIVGNNPAATAQNILAHEMLFRFGILCDLISSALFIFVTLALYDLLKGINQRLAVVMVILGSLMVTPLFFANTVNDAGALLLVRGGDFLSVFDQSQREALAMFFLRLHHQLTLANEVFWGLWLIPFGLLVYRSRFLPRILGAWLMLACFAYLALSVTGILFPEYEDKVFPYAQPVMLGEVAIMLWLVIMGAKEQRVSAARA
jgi:hypothetical protein